MPKAGSRIAGRLMLLAALALLAGCDQVLEDKGDQALDQAHEKEKEGDYRAAIQYYEASLDGTAKTADSHYWMALIYDDQLSDPVAALAHFRRYLELAPEGTHAKDAKNFASQDEFKLASTLSKGNFMSQQEAIALKNQNLDLQKQLAEARTDLQDVREQFKSIAKGVHLPEPAQKPIPPGARTYIVEPGDTFSSISRKFFKSSHHWQSIENANFNSLTGDVTLKVGMVLAIPDK